MESIEDRIRGVVISRVRERPPPPPPPYYRDGFMDYLFLAQVKAARAGKGKEYVDMLMGWTDYYMRNRVRDYSTACTIDVCGDKPDLDSFLMKLVKLFYQCPDEMKNLF
jgi:hypothetical protein